MVKELGDAVSFSGVVVQLEAAPALWPLFLDQTVGLPHPAVLDVALCLGPKELTGLGRQSKRNSTVTYNVLKHRGISLRNVQENNVQESWMKIPTQVDLF